MAGSARWDSIDAILSKISKMQALTEKLKTDVEKFESGVEKLQASSERLVEVGLEKMRSALRQSADELKQWREEIEVEPLIEDQIHESVESYSDDALLVPNSPRSADREFKALSESDLTVSHLILDDPEANIVKEDESEGDSVEGKTTFENGESLNPSMTLLPSNCESLNFSLDLVASSDICEFERMGGDLGSLENMMRIGGYLSKNSTDWVYGRFAHKVFEKMPKKKTMLVVSSVQLKKQIGETLLGPSIWGVLIFVFDPGGVLALMHIGGTCFLSSTICFCGEKIVDSSSSIRPLSSFIFSFIRDEAMCSSRYSGYSIFAALNYPWAACFDQTGSAIDVGKTRLQWDPGGNYSRHIESCWFHVCTVVCHSFGSFPTKE